MSMSISTSSPAVVRGARPRRARLGARMLGVTLLAAGLTGGLVPAAQAGSATKAPGEGALVIWWPPHAPRG
mgnify:CR=1 FL=1